MNNRAALLTIAVLLILGTIWVAVAHTSPTPTPSVACTMEAKLCPDGSSVGRGGPNCEFAECPSTTAIATATTTIAIGGQGTASGTTIGVLELLEDSRCPVDVQCIQAGTVRVRAAVDAMNRDFTFVLGKPQDVNTVTITLASVIPAQKYSTQTIAKGDYRFVFTVVPKGAPVVGIGEHCGGFIKDAPVCAAGSHCQLKVSMPDTGGTCIADAGQTSGVRGMVSLGPTCPVERNPPDPQCADKPYATNITVSHTGSTAAFSTGKSDATGAFTFSLPPGQYTLTAVGGATLPRCSPVDVTVSSTGYVTANISCDTGIR